MDRLGDRAERAIAVLRASIRGRGVATAVLLAAVVSGCSNDSSTTPAPPAPLRTFRMGFSGIPPRADLQLAIAAIDLWSQRADAATMSLELPWDSLLAGVPPETLVTRDPLGLAQYFRFKGHELWVYLDPANGLDRSGEAAALLRNGRSLIEPDIQLLFRRYAVVIDSLVQPEHLGLALETNLIRGLAPASLYAAVRQVANDAAADVRRWDVQVRLSVSVQVDWAWGRFGNGVFEGIDADVADFPFVDELGLSSYPYLAGFAVPEDIPIDYYARLAAAHDLPVMVTEGGWSSASLDTLASSEDEQRRYIERQAMLLDAASATAVFQLTFADLDLAAYPQPPGSILPLFAHCGLVDADLHPKAALAAWDAEFSRTLTPP